MEFYKNDSVHWTFSYDSGEKTMGNGVIVSIQKDFYKIKNEDGIYFLRAKDTRLRYDHNVCNECKCSDDLNVCLYRERCEERQHMCSDCAYSSDHNKCNGCSRFIYCEDTIMIRSEDDGIIDLCHDCYEEDDSAYYDEEEDQYKFK